MTSEQWDPSIARRIHVKRRQIDRILQDVEIRARRAEADASVPELRRRDGTRGRSSGYGDPTGSTASRIVDLLSQVDMSLVAIRSEAERAARALSHWQPERYESEVCSCPRDCCPDGCRRVRTDHGSQHPTCRSKRSRARRRGEAWALADVA